MKSWNIYKLWTFKKIDLHKPCLSFYHICNNILCLMYYNYWQGMCSYKLYVEPNHGDFPLGFGHVTCQGNFSYIIVKLSKVQTRVVDKPYKICVFCLSVLKPIKVLDILHISLATLWSSQPWKLKAKASSTASNTTSNPERWTPWIKSHAYTCNKYLQQSQQQLFI